MEPDYAHYTYRELLEALESIDKEAYPARVEALELRLKTWSEETVLKAMRPNNNLIGSIAIFISMACCTWILFTEGLVKAKLFFAPFILVATPFIYLLQKRKYQRHKGDYLRLDKQGVSLKLGEAEHSLLWSNVRSVICSVNKSHQAYFFEADNSQHSCSFEAREFEIDEDAVFDFISQQAKKHNFVMKSD
ncbi:hypothetical protein C1E24_08410 [Pseudoalteromonas phenolica]|uniref:Uncharacterized protein n=1 Tax=Pseudoalteromonas phenolica TaxID=161398 RepID=A0A5R9Q2I8_9GAMM|nr:hypothetical protein [Pseudoalteromonas phenolica]TLX47368.1 hypothetical protein C1E24_08410 [Pseudoalteromonas phenolica]